MKILIIEDEYSLADAIKQKKKERKYSKDFIEYWLIPEISYLTF